MGAEVLAISMLGMGVAQGVAGYQSGLSQQQAYKAEGALLEGEAFREASRIEDEGARFADEQKMAYIGSGVEIGGSAVVTLAQTDKWARTEAEAVRSRGRAIRDYYGKAGRVARNQGVASFISGVLGGAASGYSMYHSAGAGIPGSTTADPYKTGTNLATLKQLSRPGATTRIRP
jgi:hypothetical protein